MQKKGENLHQDISKADLDVLKSDLISRLRSFESKLKAKISKKASKTDLEDFKFSLEKRIDKCASKEDLKNLEARFDKMLLWQISADARMETFLTKDYFDEKMDKVFEKLDYLVKKAKDHDLEFLSNQKAHDRYNDNFIKIKDDLGVNSLETV